MLSYELCRKLRDAGLPQVGDEWLDKKGRYCNPSLDDYDVVCPTLSGLIEACGEKFIALIKFQEKGVVFFRAFMQYPYVAPYEKLNEGISTRGAEPEEAVANLWLALKKAKLS